MSVAEQGIARAAVEREIDRCTSSSSSSSSSSSADPEAAWPLYERWRAVCAGRGMRRRRLHALLRLMARSTDPRSPDRVLAIAREQLAWKGADVDAAQPLSTLEYAYAVQALALHGRLSEAEALAERVARERQACARTITPHVHTQLMHEHGRRHALPDVVQ